MKYLKSLLLLLTVLLLSFGILYLSVKRVKDAEKEVQENLVNHFAGFLNSLDRQFFTSPLQLKFSNRAYTRFTKQVADYEESYPGSKILSISIINEQPTIILSSNIKPGYRVGDLYPLPKEIIDSLFTSFKPLVLKTEVEQNKYSYEVFIPFQSVDDDKIRQIAVMEYSTDLIDNYLNDVKNTTIVNFALFLIFALLIGTLLVWRENQPFKTQRRFRHLETVAVLIICLTTVYMGAEAYEQYKISQQKVVFVKYAEAYSASLRSTLWNMQSNIINFTIFAGSSEYVEEIEFKAFAQQLMKMNTFETFYYFNDDKPLQKDNQKQYLTLPDSSIFSLKYSALESNETPYLNHLTPAQSDELAQLAFESRNDSMVYGTDVLYLKNSGDSTAYFLIVAAVPKSLHTNNNSNAFIIAVVNPKHLLYNSFKRNEWRQESLALGLVPSLNSEDEASIATYPPEHISTHKSNRLDKKADEIRFHQTYPIFIWGKTLGLSVHSTQDFEIDFYNINFVYIFGIVISLLITVLVFFIRVRWTVLQSKDIQQAIALNRRVHDLSCIRNVSELILQRNGDTSFYHQVIQELHQTLETRDIATIIIQVYDQTYVIKPCSTECQTVVAVDIVVNREKIGEINVKSIKKINFQKEDTELLHQISRLLSNFLEREIVTKALTDSELKFRTLVENAFDSIYTIEGRRFTYANKAFTDLVEYSLEELTAEDFNIDIMMTEASREIVQHRFECRQKGIEVPNRYEFQQKSKSGRILDAEVSTVGIIIEGKSVVIGMLRDISERKKAERDLQLSEEKLQQQNEELQVLNEELQVLNEELSETNNQIKVINVDLRLAKEKAEASDRLKTAFLNNISHELRTPLNGIVGSAILLIEPDSTLDEKKSISEVLTQSSDRLVRTITGYMDISMLNSGEMPVFPEKVNVRQMAKPIIEKYTQNCINKKIKLDFQWTESNYQTLFTDKNLLQKILEHLLDNAVKFTEKGRVECKITMNETYFELDVNDTGIGIDPDFQQEMFGFFIQEDNSNIRKYDGSGLGLGIVKKACELIGATIQFQSEKNFGTRFVVRIENINPNQLIAETNKTKNTMNAQISSPLILIAEDEDSNFTVLNILLTKRLNARILRAFNGQEAIQICKENAEIKMVLMDIKMPIMDGYAATTLIKEFRPTLPIIAVTAFGLTGDENKALAAGCDDYIAKPIQTTQLIEKLTNWLKHS